MTGPPLAAVIGTLALIGGVMAALGLLAPVTALIITVGMVGIALIAALIYTLIPRRSRDRTQRATKRTTQ